MVDTTNFSLTNTSKSNQYPDTPIPQSIKDYVEEEIDITDSLDAFDTRWVKILYGEGKDQFKDIKDTDQTSYKAIDFAAAYKTQLYRITHTYKDILKEEWDTYNSQEHWENAQILKAAIDTRSDMSIRMSEAIDQLEETGYIDNQTIKDLYLIGDKCSHICQQIIIKTNDFIDKNPDQEYESGKKQYHRIFDGTTNLGAAMYLRDYDNHPAMMTQDVKNTENGNMYEKNHAQEYRKRHVKRNLGTSQMSLVAMGINDTITHNGQILQAPDRPTNLMEQIENEMLGDQSGNISPIEPPDLEL